MLRDQIYVSFDLLAGLPPSVANSVGEQVIAGLILVIRKNRSIVRFHISFIPLQRHSNDVVRHSSQTEWSLVFALIRSAIPNPEAARMSFDLIASMAADGPDQIVTADNFLGLVTILDEFVTIAGAAMQDRPNKGRRTEPLTTTK